MSILASQFYSGFFGTAAIAANELAVVKWSINPTAKLEEFRNSLSGAYVVRQSTFLDFSGSLDIDYDFANGLFLTTYGGLTPGTILAGLRLFLHQTAKSALNGSFWGIPSAIVDGTPQDLTVDGKIITRVMYKGAGGNLIYPS